MLALTPLPGEELDMVNAMIDFGVLVDYKPEKFETVAQGPLGLLVCSDCRQKKDIDDHWVSLLSEINDDLQVHEFKFHGGALLGARSRIINPTHNEHLLINSQFKFALTKGLINRKIVLLNHRPCGAATHFGLSLYDSIELTLKGRSEQMRLLNNVRADISAGLHVDYRASTAPDKGQKSRHINASKWEAYKEKAGYVPGKDLFSKGASF